jgi:hypothetical protein
MSERIEMIGLRLSAEEIAEARRVAQAEDRSLSALARIALREYLTRRQHDRPQEVAESEAA